MEKEKGEIVERYPALDPAIQLQNHCTSLVFVYASLEMYQPETAE